MTTADSAPPETIRIPDARTPPDNENPLQDAERGPEDDDDEEEDYLDEEEEYPSDAMAVDVLDEEDMLCVGDISDEVANWTSILGSVHLHLLSEHQVTNALSLDGTSAMNVHERLHSDLFDVADVPPHEAGDLWFRPARALSVTLAAIDEDHAREHGTDDPRTD